MERHNTVHSMVIDEFLTDYHRIISQFDLSIFYSY
jgi:hypothetical protein